MKSFKILLSVLLILATVAVVGANPTKPEREEASSHHSSGTRFTNDYGTPNTECAKSGCSRKIATSGDTAYCTTHSGRCLNCRCYVDPDAMYCMDCIKDALRN